MLAAGASAEIVAVENTSDGGWNVDEGTGCCTATCYAPLVRTFDVASEFHVARVRLGLAALCYREEVRARLISPTGANIEIINGSGGPYFDYGVLLDSSSLNPLDDGDDDNPFAPPFYTRIAAPITTLNAFAGLPASGIWTLEVCSTAGPGHFVRALLELEREVLFSDGFETGDPDQWN